MYAPGSPAPRGHWPSFRAWYPARHPGPYPADHRAGKQPVLLYSPGLHGSRGQALHWFRAWQAAA